MNSKRDLVLLLLARAFLWALFLCILLYITGNLHAQTQAIPEPDFAYQKDREKTQNAFKEAYARNVVVLFQNEQGHGYGSGVVIETGLVLTAKHLNEPPAEFQINGKPAQVVAESKTHDILLLKADTPKFGKLKFQQKTYLGDPVFYVGNPEQHAGLLSRGYVVYLKDGGIHTDTLGAMGFSGSGLWNNKGELIGIQVQIEFFEAVGAKVSIAVPIVEAEKLLKGAKL